MSTSTALCAIKSRINAVGDADKVRAQEARKMVDAWLEKQERPSVITLYLVRLSLSGQIYNDRRIEALWSSMHLRLLLLLEHEIMMHDALKTYEQDCLLLDELASPGILAATRE